MPAPANVRAVGFLHGLAGFVSATIFTNSQPNDIIADTGPLGPGNFLFGLTGFCTVAWEYQIRHLQADGVTINGFIPRLPAPGPDEWLAPNKIWLELGERLRVVCIAGPGASGRVGLAFFKQEMG